MTDHAPTLPTHRRRLAARGGFTLVELMVATAVGAMVLAAVASIIVMCVRMVYKNQQITDSATTTRYVQEHINGEMSIAISQTTPVSIRPQYSVPSETTPVRYSRLSYRVQVGSFATVQTSAVKTSDTIVINCPSDIIPKVNDYLLMDSPNLGAGIRITAVDPENSSGVVTVTLADTISNGTIDATKTDAAADSLVRIHRQRAYETVEPTAAGLPSSSPVTELRWYESWYEPDAASATYAVLSRNVDTSARYMFAQVPEEPDPTDTAALAQLEPAVSWQFSYVTVTNGAVIAGVSSFYQTNYAEGLIMPKSGNPLNTSSILGGGSTTTTTTSTTTSSTTTSTTTSSTTTSSTTTSTTTSFTTTSTTTSFTTTSTTTSFTTTSTTTSSTTSSTTTSFTTTTTTTSVSTSSTTTSFTTTSTTTSVSTSSTTTSTTTSVSTSSTSTSFTTTSTTTSVSTSSISTSSTTTTSASTSSTTTSASTSSTSTSASTTSTTTSASTSSTTTSVSTSSTTTSSTTTSTSTASTTSTTTSFTTTSTTTSISTTSTSSTTSTTTSTTTSIPFDG